MPVALRWLLRLGPMNPIAVRLVQNASRRTKHMYIRAAYLAVLILALLWTLLLSTGGGALSYRELAEAGARSFQWIAYLQIGLICVLAPVFMAGAIAQEANPKTWDIMLSTPLTRSEIVLGNLFGRLFFILALLIASLPLFAITQYFGGVPGRSILLSYLIAGAAATLVGTIAIALSVSRLVGRRAVFAFYISVVSYIAVTWAIDLWMNRALLGAGPGGRGVTWMTAINPFLALKALLQPSTYPAAPEGTFGGLKALALERPVAAWVWLCASVSVLLALASTLTVRSGGLATIAGEAAGVPWYRRMFGLGARGAEHRPPRSVWTNPIAWREAAARNNTLSRMMARWSFIALGGLWGLLIVLLFHNGTLTAPSFQLALVTTVFGEVAVTALVAINMAATAVSREREDGTLDLLLTTPITPGQYLQGKLRGLIAYLLPMMAVPVGTLLIAGLYTLAGGFGRADGVTVTAGIPPNVVTAPVVLPESALILALSLAPFIAFCVIIGLQWSLKSKGTISSVISTVGVVGVVAGIVGLCAYQAVQDLQILGPILGALSPITATWASVHPGEAMEATVFESSATPAAGLISARLALVAGSAVAAGVYVAVVYGVHANMVRTFDMTVRKLAGVR
ncbi:MAG: ABC transporter permease [Phycisphaerales bacterium JB039]